MENPTMLDCSSTMSSNLRSGKSWKGGGEGAGSVFAEREREKIEVSDNVDSVSNLSTEEKYRAKKSEIKKKRGYGGVTASNL